MSNAELQTGGAPASPPQNPQTFTFLVWTTNYLRISGVHSSWPRVQTRARLERDEINLQFALVVSEWRVILPMMSQMPSAICVSDICVSFLYICFLAAYVIEAI